MDSAGEPLEGSREIDVYGHLHAGASALQRGHPLEQLYREVRSPRIYEGANEVPESIIARAVYADAERGLNGRR